MIFVMGFIQKLPLGPMIIWIQSTGPLKRMTQQVKKKKKEQWQILTQASSPGA